jgi:primosomal protein N' (replication factor Y)
MHIVADIVVFLGIPRMLTYLVPDQMDIRVGARVKVPLKSSQKIGVVISLHAKDDVKDLKPVINVIDKEPLIPQHVIDLLIWCSRYYHASIGSCLSLAFPPYLRKGKTFELEPTYMVMKNQNLPEARLGKRQKELLDAIPEGGVLLEKLKPVAKGVLIASLVQKKLISLKEIEDKNISLPVPKEDIRYTKDQEKAISSIEEAVGEKRFKTFLIHGVTGSGKTEVYLACAMKALSMGRSVLYMVPEISLTPQTIERIRSRIPVNVAVFHSGLTDKARAIEFLKVAQKEVRFVLGARSAIFSPLKNLGLVIVDEEHDGSYKQSEGVPYNARDLSLVRAKKENAVVVFGSATPSMETYVRAKSTEMSLVQMPNRIGDVSLPRIDIVDMRGRDDPLSDELIQSIEETLSRKEQALLFINRRGFASALVCPGCGKVLSCPHCSKGLTYHKKKGIGLCHYCGFQLKLPEICPSCGCLDMKTLGLGTERIVGEIAKTFPHARILKMDTDEINSQQKLINALDAIQKGKVDIIVGTQMIAKGHDFPNLTLVGVIHAEQHLYMPDFRAIERTFQQIVQVTGRAGRRRSFTHVIVQTLVPDHPIFAAITSYDYNKMISIEEDLRQSIGFPPYVHMARCIISSYKPSLPEAVGGEIASRLNGTDITVVGPAPAPLSFLRGSHRCHLIMTSKNRKALHNAIDRIQRISFPSSAKIKIDIDPYDML